MENILAIGSIVKVNMNNLKNDIMIIGRIVRDTESDCLYDYMGVLYPYGFLNPEQIILFNEEGIDEVIFEGYISKEEIKLSKEILNELEKNETTN